MTRAENVRILLADDHQLLRAGLRALFQAVPGFDVVAEASDGREAVRLVEAVDPDVALVDLAMPDLNGFDATLRIVERHPRTKVVILSMDATKDTVLAALRAGAVGYLVKTADPAELELAVKAAVRGETFLSSAISQHVVESVLQGVEATPLERLSPRHREVLQLIAEGHTTKSIAAKLGVTVKTAETYRRDLMAALDVHDIAGLTRYAIRTGLVSAAR